jgi:hypothetical protein
MPEVPTSLLFSGLCDLVSGAKRKPPRLAPRRSHTHAQAQPDGTAGPASRSRLASRCPENRRQRTDHTIRRAPFSVANSRSRRQQTRRTRGGARAVCPLSSVLCPLNLVGLGRLERPTSRLSGVRSNQLSYRPVQTTEDRRQMTDRPRCGLCPLSSVV